jgi:hypothetical protein
VDAVHDNGFDVRARQVPVAPLAPPPSRRVSILPAAVVLLVAVGMLSVFVLLNVVGTTTTTPTTVPTVLGGLPVSHAASAAAFRGWVQGGDPPADVASALLAPRGAVRVDAVNTGGTSSGGNYDLENRLTVPAARARLLGFYRSHLEALGWSLYSVSGGAGGATLLFQRAGGDGFYWEAGVVAQATSPTTTTYTFRLFQVTDLS